MIKVDFIWINRDQRSFEWFIELLYQMEEEQEGDEAGHHKFLDVHMYSTATLKGADMRGIALQTNIDILRVCILYSLISKGTSVIFSTSAKKH